MRRSSDAGSARSDARSPGSSHRPSPHPVVIDTDPGIDDAVAVALAVRSPECALVAVTATYGNVDLSRAVRNARFVLDLAGGDDVPVLAGTDRPLDRPPPATHRHGPEGTGGAPLPQALRAPAPVPASPDALVRAVGRAGGPVTLVTIGPLTNLALALDAGGSPFRAAIRDHLALAWPGDFNADADPAAFDRVMDAALPTRWVGVDVTGRIRIPAPFIERLQENEDRLARWLGAALAFRADARGAPVHDAVAVAEVLAPGVLDFERHTPDIGPVMGRRPAVQRASGVDADRTLRLLGRVVGPERDRSPSGGT